MAETWVINEQPTLVDSSFNVSFSSGGQLFISIAITDFEMGQPITIGSIVFVSRSAPSPAPSPGPTPPPEPLQVYTLDETASPPGLWLDQSYRTVTFDESPTGDFLTWLEANAVKQEPLVTDDLTGWAWVGNNTLDLSTLTVNTNFLINFISNSTEHSLIRRDVQWSLTPYSRLCYSYNQTPTPFGQYAVYDGDNNVWTDDAYKTIQITGGADATNTDLIKWLQDNGTLSFTPAPEPVDVSNKTFFIKDTPTFSAEATIHGNFTSGDQDFTQISVLDYEGDWELWYIDASANSVLAYSNGVWEIEYRYLTFEDGETLAASEYDAFIDLYEEYTPAPTPYTLTATYNGVNILSETVTEGVTLTYGGTILATLPEGTTTLACADTLMENDVVIYAGTEILATLECQGTIMATNVVMNLAELQAWDTPTISLSDDTVSTPVVEGVTKYKVYSDGTYMGYVDAGNVWHGEVSE